MKVIVDFNVCESNGLCEESAPGVFHLGDDDYLYVLDEHPDESQREQVVEAARRCPKQAITVADDVA
jgi:ferredoxin